MGSEIEVELEAGVRNAPVQRGLVLLLAPLAGHQERAALLDKFDLVRGEAGDREGDPVLVLALLFDVVGRPIGRDAVFE